MKQQSGIKSVSTSFYMLDHQPLVLSIVQAPTCCDCHAIHNKGIDRLNLTTWFMLLLIFICFADGKARDVVTQANQPHSETAALTPEDEDDDDKSQVDMCPLPYPVWLGGKAGSCLMLAYAYCCSPNVQGSQATSAYKLLCRSYAMSSAMHWCVMLSVQCLNQQNDYCLAE